LRGLFSLRSVILLSLIAVPASSYSVLTHEAIVDAAWDRSIRPVLLDRYPQIDLRKAHAFAYGGAIIQDLGYYPMGSRWFSDLVHYVRPGDFVRTLISEARDANELAFALGALAHYSADASGHSMAINIIVPMLYPKVARKHGRVVPYEDAPGPHLKTEFSFDVVHVAQQHYAPAAYHDFIGFEVSRPVLERAFVKTYGIPLEDVFLSLDLAFGTFRFSVSSVIPQMTKVAWAAKEDEIVKAAPGVTRDKFVYTMSRASFEREWGNQYQRPGWWSRFLAFLFRLLPKVGPLQAFAFKAPGPEAQKLFAQSFNETLDQYRRHLDEVRTNRLRLPNQNLDTGKPIEFGSYKLMDKAFERLLNELSDRDTVAPEVRSAVLGYYSGAKGLDRKVAAKLSKFRESSRSSSPGLP
jgi:hypothetical protein